jgi:hypothetical protein
VTIFEDRPFRNIKSIRQTQDLFDDLAEDEQDMLVAVAGESMGKPESRDPLIRRPFDDALIAYPFVRENWQHTRFADGSRYGVWYGSLEIGTTVHETIHHWRMFLLDAYADEDREIVADRRVFQVFCQGVLVDLRGKEERWPALVADGYEFTQPLGAYLRGQRLNGLLVRSARCEGINLASFSPDILSNPEDVCYLTYRFNPARRGPLSIERTPGVVWMEIS